MQVQCRLILHVADFERAWRSDIGWGGECSGAYAKGMTVFDLAYTRNGAEPGTKRAVLHWTTCEEKANPCPGLGRTDRSPERLTQCISAHHPNTFPLLP